MLLFGSGKRVTELEILKTWEESDETYDLPGRAIGLGEGKESESRCEVSKVVIHVWSKSMHLKAIYPKLLEVRER